MEGLKFEYEGIDYKVPCLPEREWKWWMTDTTHCCERHAVCDKLCRLYSKSCLYAYGNRKARKAFYYQCLPEEKPEEAEEKLCEKCANYKPETVSIEDPELIDKIGEFKKPEWAKWAAVDKSGLAYWYEERPEILNSIPHLWFWNRGRICKIPGYYNTADWKASLVDLRGSKPVLVMEREIKEKLNNLYVRNSVQEAKPHYSLSTRSFHLQAF